MRPNNPHRLYNDTQKNIAIYLVESKGEKIKDVARRFGCSFGTIKSWVYTAKLDRKLSAKG